MGLRLALWLPDVRRAELRPLAYLLLALLSLIAGHTLLETARDAMLLARFPPRALGLVYVAVAAAVLPAAAIISRACARWGVRRTLAASLVAQASGVGLLFVAPSSPVTLVAVYVLSGLVGGTIVPTFWTLVGTLFTVDQERRLVGFVGAAGVVGGVLGASMAAWLLRVVRVETLLPLSGAIFLLAAAPVILGPQGENPPERVPLQPPHPKKRSLPRDPFVGRIALLVAASTVAFVAIDFTFKWTIARSVPKAEIAPFVARYYAALNVASLLVQLVVSGAVVRRLGIAGTSVVTPLAFLGASVAAVAGGGRLAPVLVLKGVDGALRNSLHRAAMELVYLPLPEALRTRAKPILDGALSKGLQAVAGVALFALGETRHLSTSVLTEITALAVTFWALAAWRMNTPYLALLRRAIGNDAFSNTSTDPLDMESAEALVSYLAHEDPAVVVGAIHALQRRGRGRLVPALVLLHDDEQVLLHSLVLFAASDREDWTGLARRLLGNPRESVRMAAARALAVHGKLETRDLEPAATPRLHGYAVLRLALAKTAADLSNDPSLVELLEADDPTAAEARLGVLSAIADVPATEAILPLLNALAEQTPASRSWTRELARAIASQNAVHLIPRLIDALRVREEYGAVASALRSLGSPALDALEAQVRDPGTSRPVRVHIPDAIATFGVRRAANVLLDVIETDPDGLVRYKALRALGRLVSEANVRIDRDRVERLALANLIEHFRLLGLSAPFHSTPGFSATPRVEPTEQLLVGLLEDKLRQSLERTFRLLKIANPDEDIHGVHQAYVSRSRRERAVAAELLDTLLRRSLQTALRQLLLLAADESHPADVAARARSWTHHRLPATRDEALQILLEDRDATVAALARLHAAAMRGSAARIRLGELGRPPIELSVIHRPKQTTPETSAQNSARSAHGG